MKSNKKFYGHYRGTVIDNYDPKVKGRIKIYVRGVYPEEFKNTPADLPWAEPAMPIFGGSAIGTPGESKPETGISSPPHKNAELWVFFEQGDHNYPIYCFSSQSGDGWMSEHKNQHVIQTDNVRIRIDENPSLPFDGAPEKSTSKFNSYNENCTHMSKLLAKESIPTRLDIDIVGNVNVVINGSTNILMNGNVYQEINGDKHETIIGNHYINHEGDLHVTRTGSVVYEQDGDTTEVYKTGDYIKIREGNEYINQVGNYNEYVSNNYSKYIGVTEIRNVPTRQTVISQYDSRTVIGVNEKMTKGSELQTVAGYKSNTVLLDSAVPVSPPQNGSYNTNCNYDYKLNASNSIYTTASVDRIDSTGIMSSNTVGTTYTITAGSVITGLAPAINLN